MELEYLWELTFYSLSLVSPRTLVFFSIFGWSGWDRGVGGRGGDRRQGEGDRRQGKKDRRQGRIGDRGKGIGDRGRRIGDRGG